MFSFPAMFRIISVIWIIVFQQTSIAMESNPTENILSNPLPHSSTAESPRAPIGHLSSGGESSRRVEEIEHRGQINLNTLPEYPSWTRIQQKSSASFLFEEPKTEIIYSVLDELNRNQEKKHRILQNINMPEFCEEIRKHDHFYAHIVDSKPYDTMRRKLKFESNSFRAHVNIRNCNIITGNSQHTLFVTAPPKLEKYEPIQNRVLVFFGGKFTKNYTMPFSIIVVDFEERFPIFKIEREEQLTTLPENFPQVMYRDHLILKHINMNQFCEELRRSDKSLFHKGISAHLNTFEEITIQISTIEAGEKITIPAKRCQLKSYMGRESWISISPSENSESVIALMESAAGWEYYGTWKLTNLSSNFPVLDMIFDDIMVKDLEELPANTYNENKDHRIFQNIDINAFCEELRVKSKGYFTQDRNYAPNKFSLKPNYRITAKNNTTNNVVLGRRCQLQILGNNEKEIVLTAPSQIEIFQGVQGRVVVLTCAELECSILTTVVIREFIRRYPVIKLEKLERIDSSILDQFPDNIYQYHRILQNINIEGFCKLLSKKYPSYESKSDSSGDGYRVVTENTLELPNGQSKPISFSRSCLLKEKSSPTSEIYVTALSYSLIMGSSVILKNTVVVLVCQTRICKFDKIVLVEELEVYFPIIVRTSNTTPDNTIINESIGKGNLEGRIFKNIDMNEFCNDLRNYSRGLYLQSSLTENNPFEVYHEKNLIVNNENYPVKMRSCNLIRIDNENARIFVTSPSSTLEMYRDAVIVLSCEKKKCSLEMILTIYNFKTMYPLLEYGMKFDSTKNEYLEIYYIKHGQPPEHRLFRTDEIRPLCEKLQQFSDGEYVPATEITENQYKKTEPRIIRIPRTSYTKEISVRPCQLISGRTPIKKIVLASPPLDPKYAPIENNVIILGCDSHSLICTPETMLTLLNADTVLPPGFRTSNVSAFKRFEAVAQNISGTSIVHRSEPVSSRFIADSDHLLQNPRQMQSITRIDDINRPMKRVKVVEATGDMQLGSTSNREEPYAP